MFFRFGSKSGKGVPPVQQALHDINNHLQQQQQRWMELVEQDPAAFASLESEIHRCFGKLADQFTASLLTHAAAQPALQETAQKK